MSRLVPCFLIVAGFLVLFAGPGEIHAQKEKKRAPFSGKVTDVNKNAEGQVASFFVAVSAKVSKTAIVDENTKYEYMKMAAKVDQVVVGATVGVSFDKVGSDTATTVKITALPKK